MDQKVNQLQNTVCLEQQMYASSENFTPTLLVILETFRRSACMQSVFLQFSRNNTCVWIPGKLSELHLHAWLFSNPHGKVLIIVGISWSQNLRMQPKKNNFWKNTNCDNNNKKIRQKQIVKNTNGDKTQLVTKPKMWQHTNCDKTQTVLCHKLWESTNCN